MPECRNCGTALQAPYRFCPMCAAPQTDEARRRLKAYVEKRARALDVGGGGAGETGGADGDLLDRVRYAVGYVAVVAGLSTLSDVGGVFLLLAGLSVLPPVQRFVERRLDRPVRPEPTFGVAGALFALGVAVLAVV